MSQGLLVFSGAGMEDEMLWLSQTGVTAAGGTLSLNFGQGNGFQVAAAKGYSTTAAPCSLGFSYQGGTALPDAQFPTAAPVAPNAQTDPVPVGLTIDDSRALLANISGGGNAQTWIIWLLFRRKKAC